MSREIDIVTDPPVWKFNRTRKFYVTAQKFDWGAGPEGARCQRLDRPPWAVSPTARAAMISVRPIDRGGVRASSRSFRASPSASRLVPFPCRLRLVARLAKRLKIGFVVRPVQVLRKYVIDRRGDD